MIIFFQFLILKRRAPINYISAKRKHGIVYYVSRRTTARCEVSEPGGSLLKHGNYIVSDKLNKRFYYLSFSTTALFHPYN